MKHLGFVPLLHCLFFGLVIGLSLSCGSINKRPSENCDELAVVKNFNYLDGCSWGFVGSDGAIKMPADLENLAYVPVEGELVQIGYTELPDFAGSCMVEEKRIRATCIRKLSEPCAVTQNPMEVPWIKLLEKSFQPAQIIRYRRGDSYAYLFSSKKNNYLYDCTGILICQAEGFSFENVCDAEFKQLGDPLVIWIVDY